MRIIDLLNKIAKGEEVPKKIKHEDCIYILHINEDNLIYYQQENCKYFMFEIKCLSNLNDEIEIIEEEKEIEEINIKQEKNIKNNWKWKIKDTEHDYNISTPQKIMCDKINELVRELNKIKKEGK